MRDADGTMRKPTDTNLHFVFYDNTMPDVQYRNNLDISRILRRRAFVDEPPGAGSRGLGVRHYGRRAPTQAAHCRPGPGSRALAVFVAP